ncbi:carbohydrate-binding protein [Methylobacter sp.]|uniref:carbohydrate-binding protein n=1 Tax=Methylobacter sp. TaxID=2051955 RepID=UPI00248A255D|nr:carbohydrate-binding protein [Methylobacter sp.]MDI1279028.1 carbohydrate-binding protein [Methylobacter sp.]MDI1359785.1 carbohydrate-binding protein [Methylobacter sp.]
MRKIMINQAAENSPYSDLNFLDLEHLAQVEFTSECTEHPVESALLLTEDPGAGWQAASAGEQTIRLVFDQPRTIEHIFLMFDEQQQSRTQEFVLLWLMDKEDAYREILRQQYHFSPPGTTREIEHYEVRLNQLKVLELRIIPDISGGEACAGLKQLRLA